MSPTLEDQERHLLVKVIDRILYKLDDLVRPYVHKVETHTHTQTQQVPFPVNDAKVMNYLFLCQDPGGD